jgi:hypothetical protein
MLVITTASVSSRVLTPNLSKVDMVNDILLSRIEMHVRFASGRCVAEYVIGSLIYLTLSWE